MNTRFVTPSQTEVESDSFAPRPVISKMRGAKYRMALMPESWLKKAIRNASRIGVRSRADQKPPPPDCSRAVAVIWSARVFNSASLAAGSIDRSTATPLARSPFRVSSHRGLSGMNRHATVYSSDGNAITPSIHRQLSSPIPWSSQFDRNATRIPKTMLNWNRPVSRPRRSGGEISAMYSGAATVETPMPMPPMKRATMNDQTSVANAD